MTKLLNLLFASFFFVCTNCFAQSITDKTELFGGHLGDQDEKVYFEGTRFLYDDFIPGDLYADGELIFRQLPLRLNLHNDEIEFLKNDSVSSVGKSRGIDRIVINEEVFMLLDDNLDSGVSGFVKRWNNESPMLLTSMKQIFYSAMKGYADFELYPNRFERVDTHYILTSKDEIIEVTSVKKLIEFLGHSPELTSFAKERKISAVDPVELIELLDYYRDLAQIHQ